MRRKFSGIRTARRSPLGNRDRVQQDMAARRGVSLRNRRQPFPAALLMRIPADIDAVLPFGNRGEEPLLHVEVARRPERSRISAGQRFAVLLGNDPVIPSTT